MKIWRRNKTYWRQNLPIIYTLYVCVDYAGKNWCWVSIANVSSEKYAFFSGIGICYDNAFKLAQSCFCDVFVLSWRKLAVFDFIRRYKVICLYTWLFSNWFHGLCVFRFGTEAQSCWFILLDFSSLILLAHVALKEIRIREKKSILGLVVWRETSSSSANF